MKLLKRLTSLVLSLVVAMTVLVLPAEAADVYWDGSTALQSGKTYIINSTVKLHRAVTVPENTTLKITGKGQLLIYKSGSLSVNGLLRLERNASITNSGTLTVNKTGTVRNYGEIKSTISATLSVKGSILNYADGSVRTSSKTLVYKGANITNTGSLYILNSSSLTCSGKITNTLSGYMSVQGALSVTLSGNVKSAGHLFVGSLASVKISGTLHLTSNSSYNSYGVVVATANGNFINDSTRKRRYENTAALLEKYPEVTAKGIDVSYAQGNIDWKKVADSGIEFAIIRIGRGACRAGETAPKMDDYFIRNIEGATANGIDVGVYFYSYADSVEDARQEASFVVNALKGYKLTYPIIYDMEENVQSVDHATEQAEVFMKVVSDAGYYPMLYTYKNWAAVNLDHRILEKYSLWLAEITTRPTYSGNYYIWQYSYTGRVNGINGDVDLDIAFRDFPKILKENGLNHL